ncbi:metallo-beta-lactamase domain-containing protein 1-like [Diaphorina citri]|uniref:Metallo-beta-lactamase domain-containing protein 1 n=1 Tax=Diaphorina citri TaxID=121845 RepID=A0A3Q0IMH1_DIACI|nr:metallo-beta-lactamase domain-containing protein 1-like [Diaphorina citri]XP_026677486.1 metallo-beta-lactamase domain-containing protein 1-like [Diaphorina citri]XP_026677487.1 metallo-beta-lactamase domain-containing protein 1-like [Diaphorina citri]XP_026677488.1 metallo-beta-lactamase domain-containing protein 1-like [Diaphorina citri]
MPSPYEVHVLYEGYSKILDSGGMSANCTCTLITGGQHKIIVDTMTAWDGDRIVEALARHKVSCSEITYVICTHGHSDHIGNNNLFRSAKHIVGYSISEKDFYHDPQFESGEDYIIDDFIKVTPTPGHTLTDVSVLVQTKDDLLIAVTGKS